MTINIQVCYIATLPQEGFTVNAKKAPKKNSLLFASCGLISKNKSVWCKIRLTKYPKNLQLLLGTCNFNWIARTCWGQAGFIYFFLKRILYSFCSILMNKPPGWALMQWELHSRMQYILVQLFYLVYTVKFFFHAPYPSANLDSLTINSLSKHSPHNHHLITNHRPKQP